MEIKVTDHYVRSIIKECVVMVNYNNNDYKMIVKIDNYDITNISPDSYSQEFLLLPEKEKSEIRSVVTSIALNYKR